MPPEIRKLIGPTFAHTKTVAGFMSDWKAMREELCGPALPMKKLPRFCAYRVKQLFETSEQTAMTAVKTGDVPFFIAWLFRIDQIDVEMIKLGKSVADRVPLIRARTQIDGYRIVAEARLKRLGGAWPPRSKNDSVLR